MALAFHSNSSEPCGFAPVTFAPLPPKPSRPWGAQEPSCKQGVSWLSPGMCRGSPPGPAQPPVPDVSFLGCRCPPTCRLPISAGLSAQTSDAVAGQRGWLGQRQEGHRRCLPGNNPPFGGRCVYGGRQLPAGRARAVPTASPRSPTPTPPAAQDHGQNE